MALYEAKAPVCPVRNGTGTFFAPKRGGKMSQAPPCERSRFLHGRTWLAFFRQVPWQGNGRCQHIDEVVRRPRNHRDAF